MRINRSEQSALFTEEEALQLQLESVAHGHPLSPGQKHRGASEKPALSSETSPQGKSTPTVHMQQEELDDLLVEALQGHRAVLAELASMQERLMGEATAIRIAIDSVTSWLQEEYYEEEETDHGP